MEISQGDEVQRIPFINPSADVMDAKARVIQENARIAEIPLVDAVAGNSGDFEGLANALGVENTEPEGAAQASLTQ